MAESTNSAQTIQADSNGLEKNPKMKIMILIKLVILGLILPPFDLGTDLAAIYRYWSSSQWILNYLSIGLSASIIGHNLIAGSYAVKNWSVISSRSSNAGIRASFFWKFLRVVAFIFGVGNIQIAVELIMEIVNVNHIDQQ